MTFKNQKCFWITTCCVFLFASVLFLGFSLRDDRISVITLEKGSHEFPEGLKISEKEVLVIEPGSTLFMGENARIEIDGKIIAKGTSDEPIIFKGKDDVYWRGIVINGRDETPDIEVYRKLLKEKNFEKSDYLDSIENGNFFVNCHFENLMTDGKETAENRVKSVIEARRTAVTVSNCSFSDIVHIGCVQTEESLALIKNNYVDSYFVMKVFHLIRSVHITYANELVPHRYEWNTWAEGVYSKSSVAIVVDNIIEGLPDNGIDNDYSLSYIIGNKILDVYDEGIDIDNKTEAYVFGNEIESTGNSGILISNQSRAILLDNIIKNANSGVSLRNGGYVIAQGLEIKDSEPGIKLFNQVPLFIHKDDWNKVRQEFSNLTPEDFDYYGYYTIKDGIGAVKLLEEFYDEYEEVFVFNLDHIPHDLKNLFKTIDIFSLKDVTEIPKEIKNLHSLFRYHNGIYLSESKVNSKEVFLTNSFFTIKGSYINNQNEQIDLNLEKSLIDDAPTFEEHEREILDLIDMVEYLRDLIKKAEKTHNDF